MKKLTILTLFFFCFASLVAGFSVLPKKAMADEVSAPNIEISSVEDLKAYVKSYASNQNIEGKEFAAKNDDSIVLTSNIVFGNDDVLEGTIGTEENPFCGSFDGNGYYISNMKIQTPQTSREIYGGLFGVVEGTLSETAKIKNVAFNGHVSITAGEGSSANIGVLCGRAENVSINNVQVSISSLNLTYQNNYSVNFGLLIGNSGRAELKNIVARNSQEENFVFSNENTYYIGGVIGKSNNTNLTHAVVMQNFRGSNQENSNPKVFVGGVIGNLTGGKIINVAIENQYNFSQNVLKGEIVGQLLSPAPIGGNISFVHWKQNNLSIFGQNLGNYQVEDSYNLTAAFNDFPLSNLKTDSNGDVDYFVRHQWSKQIDFWDFKTAWYVSNKNAYLQNFRTNFTVNFGIEKYEFASSFYAVKIDPEGDGELGESAVTESSKSGRYGDEFEIYFGFVNDVVGGKSESIAKYFDRIKIEHNSEDVVTINFDDNGKIEDCSVSDILLYQVEPMDNDQIIKFKISSLNMETSGDYTIKTDAKTYQIQANSRLVVLENDQPVDQHVQPAFVKYNTTNRTDFTVYIHYFEHYTFTTELKQENTAYAIYGWRKRWKENSDFKEKYLVDSSNQNERLKVVDFTFGDQFISESCSLYADYTEDACEVLFSLDEGIDRIVCGGQTVDHSIELEGEGLKMPRTSTQLRLDIYVKQGYEFDPDEFIDNMDIYKGGSGGGNVQEDAFCTLVDDPDYILEEKLYRYQFMINMTRTKGGQYETRFTIQPITKKIETKDLTWVWWTLGGVGGAILLAGITFLIVFLIRRRGFGGGSGSKPTKIKKSSYKNMYY